MKTILTIEGYQLETGLQATLYHGVHDTTDQQDKDFHRYLITHYQKQGWATMVSIAFIIERKPDGP